MFRILNTENTHVLVVLLQHTKTPGTTNNPANMHSSDQSWQQSAPHIYFSSSNAPLWEVLLSAAAMGLWAFTSTGIVTHTHSPAMC